MTTSAQPENGTSAASQYSLSAPPPGATFEYDEVKTDRGQKSLGNRPILTWQETKEGFDGAVAFYGETGMLRFANGTSARVSFQGIIRRAVAAGKSDEEIAKLQLEFRPGSRQGGASTPVSRAAAAARKAAAKFNGDAMAQLMEKIASGEISSAQLEALGISASDLQAPAVEEEEGEEAEV